MDANLILSEWTTWESAAWASESIDLMAATHTCLEGPGAAQWAYTGLRVSTTILVDPEEERGAAGARRDGEPKRWRVGDLWTRALAEEEMSEETRDNYLGKVRVVIRRDRAAGERETHVGGAVSHQVIRDNTFPDGK